MTLRLLISELTGNVYAGNINKLGTGFIGKKHNVTDDFVALLLFFIEFHESCFYVERDGRKWAIKFLAKEVEK